jgi:hypothetical protein
MADGCTFDQQAVAAELQRVASRNPGGRPVSAETAVAWREPSGTVVKLSYGGCVDLGVELEVTDATETGAALEQSVLAALGKYWSQPLATALENALREGNVQRTVVGETTTIEISQDPVESFPFEVTIILEPGRASVSWQEG